MFCYWLEDLAILFNPFFNVSGYIEFVIDFICYLFRVLKLVDKIVRFKNIRPTSPERFEDLVDNPLFVLHELKALFL